ncbi:hypothetical protein ABPG75_010133 [Micractinium tetrahymenae]
MGGLTFSSQEAELQFALQQAERCYISHLCSRASFLVKSLALAAPAAAAGCLLPSSALLLGLAGASGLLLALIARRLSPRLLHPLEAAVDVMQPVCACALFHALYPAAPGAGPLRSLAFLLGSNGVLALIVRAKVSPLPFRWQLPTVLAAAAALLAHTRSLCGSALLQHGFRTLHTLACTLLPVLFPALMDLMPRDGLGALLAPAPPADDEGAALCAAYQAPSLLLGCAALACHLYAAEARARKAFLAAGAAAGAAASAAAVH